MAKRPFRSARIDKVDIPQLCERVEGAAVVLGTDVAKVDLFVAVADRGGQVFTTIRW